jgi:hypothetical protein
MGSKIAFVLVIGLLACATNALAQKNKIKKEPTELRADTNTVNGKAALRGSELMKASKDSLKASPIMASSGVVDTFLPAPRSPMTFTLTKAADFQAARQRITDAEKDLQTAAAAVALASQSGKYSDALLEERAAKIKALSSQLEAVSKRLAELQKKWEVGRQPIAAIQPKIAPKQNPVPVTPAPGTGPGKKGIIGSPKQPDPSAPK